MRVTIRLVCIAVIAHAAIARAEDPLAPPAPAPTDAPPAAADPPPPPPAPAQPQPWAVGVSAESKATARLHLDAGNALLLEHKYSEALVEYRTALAAWNHPAIRFNVVRCLVQLERLVEASDELHLALQYGAPPFAPTIYSEALGYEKMLATQIGTLEIKCVQSGVDLRMDGQTVITCPGQELRRVMPGQHQIVGKKEGFVPQTVEVVVLGGKRAHASVVLDPLTKVARIERRWNTWVPWAVVGSGLALVGFGELFHLKAASDHSQYTKLISQNCRARCMPGEVDDSLETSARVENGIAISMFAMGAAVVVTGGVMLYLNRGHTVYDTNETSSRSARLQIVPLRSGAALGITTRF